MIKIGKTCSLIAILFLHLVGTQFVWGQDVSVEATLSETNIFSGESVRLDLSISGQSLNSINRPQIPSISGLRWLSGSTSQSTSYSYVNGRASVTYTYGYSFVAENPGNYTFPSLPIDVDGKRYSTKQISFKVLDPNSINKGNATRTPDIYVRLEPNTTNPVVGEQVIANIVLYFKKQVEVTSYNPSPGWKAEGFWKEDLENNEQVKTTSTLIGGVRYQRARLMQTAIFPTKSGSLELSPFEVVVQIRDRNRRRDIFSFGLGQERKEIQTLPVTINVRPLPPVDAVYSGAVGEFTISRTVTPETALVGESIEITTSIYGEGNIPLIVKPEYDFPDALELYDPSESSKIDRSNQQISGLKTFTDLVIARNEGQYIIPAQKFAYYNPKKRAYSTVNLPPLSIIAKKDPNRKISNSKELRFDVNPSTGLAYWVFTDNKSLTDRTWVWLLLILPVFALGIGFIAKNYNHRLNNDSAFSRSQKAKDIAWKGLAAASAATTLKQGYHLLEKSIYQYVSDKLNLPKAGVSSKELTEAVLEKTDNETAKELKRMLDKCETISYAPNASQEGLEIDIERTQILLKKIGKMV